MPTKTITFDPQGPFEVPLTQRRLIDKDALYEFWQQSKVLSDLRESHGLYVFAIGTAGASRKSPLYIGQANKSTFGSECFNSSNQNKINHALTAKGRLFLFLVRYVPGGKKNAAAIKSLENQLISLAQASSPETLVNTHGARPRYQLRINGVLNAGRGKPSIAAVALRKTLGLDGV